MALTAERVPASKILTYPKLSFTAEEVRSANETGVPFQQRRDDGVNATVSLLAASLAKATGKDKLWQQEFVTRVNSLASARPLRDPLHESVNTLVKLDAVVTAVMSAKLPNRPKLNSRTSIFAGLHEVERAAGRVRALETALNTTTFLIQTVMDVKGTQSIKREAKLPVTTRGERPKNGTYLHRISQIEKAQQAKLDRSPITVVGLYEQWKEQLRERTEEAHWLHRELREDYKKLGRDPITSAKLDVDTLLEGLAKYFTGISKQMGSRGEGLEVFLAPYRLALVEYTSKALRENSKKIRLIRRTAKATGLSPDEVRTHLKVAAALRSWDRSVNLKDVSEVHQ